MSAASLARVSLLALNINQINETDKIDQTDELDQINQIDQMTDSPFKQYYRVDEVADYFNVSVRTIYRLIEEGELRRTKIRGCLRIPVWEIERYEKELEREMAQP